MGAGITKQLDAEIRQQKQHRARRPMRPFAFRSPFSPPLLLLALILLLSILLLLLLLLSTTEDKARRSQVKALVILVAEEEKEEEEEEEARFNNIAGATDGYIFTSTGRSSSAR